MADLDAHVAQSSDALCPVSFDHGSPFELEAQLGEKRDSGIKRFHDDADVVHPFKRHGAILAERKLTGVRKARGIRCPDLRLGQRSGTSLDARAMPASLRAECCVRSTLVVASVP